MSKHLSGAVGCAQAWSLELSRCREKDSEGGEKMFRGQRDEENMGELQSMFAVIKMTESEKEKELSEKGKLRKTFPCS